MKLKCASFVRVGSSDRAPCSLGSAATEAHMYHMDRSPATELVPVPVAGAMHVIIRKRPMTTAVLAALFWFQVTLVAPDPGKAGADLLPQQFSGWQAQQTQKYSQD